MSLARLSASDIFVPVEIEEHNIYDGILKVLRTVKPNWPQEKINFKVFL